MSTDKNRPPLLAKTEIEAATEYIEKVEAEHAANESKKLLEMPLPKGSQWKN